MATLLGGGEGVGQQPPQAFATNLQTAGERALGGGPAVLERLAADTGDELASEGAGQWTLPACVSGGVAPRGLTRRPHGVSCVRGGGTPGTHPPATWGVREWKTRASRLGSRCPRGPGQNRSSRRQKEQWAPCGKPATGPKTAFTQASWNSWLPAPGRAPKSAPRSSLGVWESARGLRHTRARE